MGRTTRLRFNDRQLFVWSAIAPMLAFYAVWLFFPIAYSFLMSVYDWNPLLPPSRQEFLGLGNYAEALKDPILWITVRNTLYFAVLSVPLSTTLALWLAVLINSARFGAAVWRTLYFTPVVTSMVAASILWSWVYQPQFGLLNNLARAINEILGTRLPTQTRWLTDSSLAMPSVVLFSTWKNVGYPMVIFLAGLQSIPVVFYEAAKVDGASRWHLFRHVTLPLLQPTTLFVVVTGIIGALQVFTQVFIMTRGGPGNSTRVMVYYLYEKAFSAYRFGYASTVAVLLFLIILSLTLVQLRVMRVRWEY
jgi:multiple sugar transport system permease protein